ncbi:glutaredoxin family protein [Pseudomonas sp. MAG002Y]|uniref:glutaredoxin family protein n=1 Tax=Pseudomonas sp. MAG002Y TaxID=2678690 RepID=UPI001C60D454|nr:glutaredoxin family protein [Pseudomonas sp. MAG002Y]MBW5413905.1 glutaredoxin family protein [Pseudomonas sp. MAG002Y]
MSPHCQLLVTTACHLCHDAERVLMPFVEHGLLVEAVDIVELDGGVERYGMRIPVLRHLESGRELDWPFNCEQIATFLMQD